MDIKLGITDSETTFNYALVDYMYQLHGSVHTTPSGTKRVQYAKEDKYLFTVSLTFVTSDVWDDLVIEINNSKLYDLNLIIGEDNYTVRIIPESISKKPILGSAEAYNITFNLIEV